MNGVLTSTSERWSDSQDSTQWATIAAFNALGLTVFSGRCSQDTAYINCHAAVFPLAQIGDRVGDMGSSTNLIPAWGISMSDHDTFNKFLI